jgi:hypothetical protein
LRFQEFENFSFKVISRKWLRNQFSHNEKPRLTKDLLKFQAFLSFFLLVTRKMLNNSKNLTKIDGTMNESGFENIKIGFLNIVECSEAY